MPADSKHAPVPDRRSVGTRPVRRNVSARGKARNPTRDNRLIDIVKMVPDQLDANTVLEKDADGHEP